MKKITNKFCEINHQNSPNTPLPNISSFPGSTKLFHSLINILNRRNLIKFRKNNNKNQRRQIKIEWRAGWRVTFELNLP